MSDVDRLGRATRAQKKAIGTKINTTDNTPEKTVPVDMSSVMIDSTFSANAYCAKTLILGLKKFH